jgi:hypothetical protein
MSKVQLQGNASGTGVFTIASPNSNTDRTLTLPDNTGTILTTATNLAGQTGVGKVLQVVSSGQVADPGIGTTSTGGADVTAYSLSITPTASTSRVFCVLSMGAGAGGAGSQMAIWWQLRRQIGGGSFSSLGPNIPSFDYTNAVFGLNGAPSINGVFSYNFVDSPATTSTVTYRMRLYSNGTNSVYTTGAGFHMTLMEIAA